jgi:hypothetical protein
VIDPTEVGAAGQVQALAPPHTTTLLLSSAQRPPSRSARAVWISETRDLAIVRIDDDPIPGIETPRFGLVPRVELRPYPSVGVGFPAAAGAHSHQIVATLSWVLDDQRFNLDIATALPKKWREWAGLSGAIIFVAGLPVGVVRTVKRDWDGLLTATPIEHLLSDQRFGQFWADEGLGRFRAEEIIPLQQTILSQVASLIYRINRKNASEQILKYLRSLNARSAPQVIMIPGRDEDEHRHLIQQLSQDPTVQRIVGRSAASDDVIVYVPWPVEEREIDADLRFEEVIEWLYRRVRVEPPSPGQPPNVELLRERLNDAVAPRAFWLLVRRAIAIAGHGKLLGRFLEFWQKLPPGQPVIILLCLAWDEPTRTANSMLPFRIKRELKPDPDLEPTINLALHQNKLLPTDELDMIDGDHIGHWIDEIRGVCGYATPEKFDGLHISLLNRVGKGKRLRRVSADIGELLPNI